MKWNELTGMQPETEEEKRLKNKASLQFLSAFGRMALVTLLGFTTMTSLAALPDSAEKEIAAAVNMQTAFGTVSAIELAFLGTVVWAIAPIALSLHRLWRLHQVAKRGGVIGEKPDVPWDE